MAAVSGAVGLRPTARGGEGAALLWLWPTRSAWSVPWSVHAHGRCAWHQRVCRSIPSTTPIYQALTAGGRARMAAASSSTASAARSAPDPRADARGQAGSKRSSTELVDGPQDHHRFRDHVQQGSGVGGGRITYSRSNPKARRAGAIRNRSFTAWSNTAMARWWRHSAHPTGANSRLAHCLAWPVRIDGPAAKLDLAKVGSLTFESPDHDRFPAARWPPRARDRGSGSNHPQCGERSGRRSFYRWTNRLRRLADLVEATLRRRSAEMRPRNPKISMRRLPLTIWQDHWRMTSCPK